MARVTVEDCAEKIPNRFELVLIAAQRAKEISSGATLTIARDNDKNTVIALREIAAGSLDINKLRELLLSNLSGNNKIEEIAEEEENSETSLELAESEEIIAEENLDYSYSDDIDFDDLEEK